MNIIAPGFIKNWQTPAQTEKYYYTNHLLYNRHCDTKKDDIAQYYFAFPWASFLDYYHDPEVYQPNSDQFNQVIKTLSCKNYIISDTYYRLNTICQHIYWHKLIKIWERLNITHAYCSHFTYQWMDHDTNININSWPLYAVNKENLFRNEDLIYIEPQNKKYLCSFMGCIDEPYYRSSIRKNIYKIISSQNSLKVFISVNNDWFFREETFGLNLNKFISENVKKYNNVLSNSVFSLCPEGSGPNTIRLWESMSVGSIPVLFANDWVKPIIKEYDWSDLCITIGESETNNLIDILKSISHNRICELSRNCINAYNIFKNLHTGYYL